MVLDLSTVESLHRVGYGPCRAGDASVTWLPEAGARLLKRQRNNAGGDPIHGTFVLRRRLLRLADRLVTNLSVDDFVGNDPGYDLADESIPGRLITPFAHGAIRCQTLLRDNAKCAAELSASGCLDKKVSTNP